MNNNFENQVLNDLKDIKDIIHFRYKNENGYFVKINGKFKLKTSHLGTLFSDMFFKCDMVEQMPILKEKIIEIINKECDACIECMKMFKDIK